MLPILFFSLTMVLTLTVHALTVNVCDCMLSIYHQ